MHPNKLTLTDTDVVFRRYYQRYLQPLEKQYETLRKTAVRQHFLRIFAALIGWLAGWGAIIYLTGSIDEIWPFVAFFALVTGIGLGLWAWLPAGAHQLRLQEQVLTRIVPFFGDLQYCSDPEFSVSQYQDWMILPKFNKTYSEDQIKGIYRGVPLKLAEVRLEYDYRRSSDSHSSTWVAFKGLIVDFELVDEFQGVTMIRSKDKDMNGDFKIDPELKHILEGSGFEVFANDESMGSTMVGIWFLDRLAKVSKQFEAKQLFASIHKNRLVMLIEHQEDYFEMSHRHQTNFAQDAERIKAQLERFFAIVDVLQLRGNIGTKSGSTSNEPVFPEIKKNNSGESYDIGGWGCFIAFILFAAAMSAYLVLLDTNLSSEGLFGWSSVGGFLLALGLWQTFYGLKDRAFGTFVFGLILWSGAMSVFAYYGAADTLLMMQSWLPVKGLLLPE